MGNIKENYRVPIRYPSVRSTKDFRCVLRHFLTFREDATSGPARFNASPYMAWVMAWRAFGETWAKENLHSIHHFDDRCGYLLAEIFSEPEKYARRWYDPQPDNQKLFELVYEVTNRYWTQEWLTGDEPGCQALILSLPALDKDLEKFWIKTASYCGQER